MIIDLQTLAAAVGVSNLLQAIALYLLCRTKKTYPGVLYWLHWSVCLLLAFFLMASRQIILPELAQVSILITNILLIAGPVFLFMGLQKFLGKDEHRPLAFTVILVGALCVFYMLFINREFDYNLRAIMLYLAGGTASLAGAGSLFRHKTRSIAISANFLAAVLAGNGLYFYVRSVAALCGYPYVDVFTPSPFHTATYLTCFIVTNLVTLGLIIMVSQRSLAETTEIKEHFESIFSTGPNAIMLIRLQDGLFLDVNPEFTAQTGFPREDIVGRTNREVNIWKNPGDFEKLTHELLNNTLCMNLEFDLQRKDGSSFSSILSSRLITIDNQAHVIMVTQDLTEQKRTENQMRTLITQLQKALEEIKTLKGIVPICANCKSIRDDKGYWEQVETYVARFTEARFSHGICPDCMKRLYPDLNDCLANDVKKPGN